MQPSDALVDLAEKEVSRRLKDFQLRPRQREVLAALASGQNAFAGLPTGYGKSLCYWAPAAAWGWKVWVISPLISLIQDQAASCRELGIPAAAWFSGLKAAERNNLAAEMQKDGSLVSFLSPERLVHWWESGFISELEQMGCGPDLVAIDEMHCFEDWRGFRAGYQEAFAPIKRLEARGASLLGLSASLSRSQADEWMREICSNHIHIGSSLGRDNLRLRVVPIETERELWLQLVSELRSQAGGEAAIVYCATRGVADEVARWLSSAGIPASAYHAGLPPAVRAARSKAFRLGHLPVVCATSAFGMGIDYPKVTRVIHFSMPYSLESYWQEAGRAGRDGRPAEAIAFWRRSEISRARRMDAAEKEKFLAVWLGWASGECRKQVIASRFSNQERRCGHCDRCDPEKFREKNIWWLSPEAKLDHWARQKIFGSGKNLDAVIFPDSVCDLTTPG